MTWSIFIKKISFKSEIDLLWKQLCISVDKIEKEIFQTTTPLPNQRMCHFLILAEDRRYGKHPGVDIKALCRAIWKNYFCLNSKQGASTIAMQLVRTLTGRYEKTWWRKISEIWLAILLSKYIPKNRLPLLYLWCAYYGWRMNNFKEACSYLKIHPNSTNASDDAKLIARLKYPQPRKPSSMYIEKLRMRKKHILHLSKSNIDNKTQRKNINMLPFHTPLTMSKLKYPYPDSDTLKSIIKIDGQKACEILAQLWISEGVPYIFSNTPEVYASMRKWLGKKLHIHPKEISITGSARFGYSLKPEKFKYGKPFDASSDLDLFTVSEDLFNLLKYDFEIWVEDCKDNKDIPLIWPENIKFGLKNIEKGFIDQYKMPPKQGFSTVDLIYEVMSGLKKEIPSHIRPKKASIRCFKNWKSAMKQISLNLKALEKL